MKINSKVSYRRPPISYGAPQCENLGKKTRPPRRSSSTGMGWRHRSSHGNVSIGGAQLLLCRTFPANTDAWISVAVDSVLQLTHYRFLIVARVSVITVCRIGLRAPAWCRQIRGLRWCGKIREVRGSAGGHQIESRDNMKQTDHLRLTTTLWLAHTYTHTRPVKNHYKTGLQCLTSILQGVRQLAHNAAVCCGCDQRGQRKQ